MPTPTSSNNLPSGRGAPGRATASSTVWIRLRNAYLPPSPDSDTWSAPEGPWRRLRPTLDGLTILVLATVVALAVGSVFAAGTLCGEGCDQTRFDLGAVSMTLAPLVSSVSLVIVTLLHAARGRRPVRWWILGCVLLAVWLLLGLTLMQSAIT